MYKAHHARSMGVGWARVTKPQPVPVPVCTHGVYLHGFVNPWYSLLEHQFLSFFTSTIISFLSILAMPHKATQKTTESNVQQCQSSETFSLL